MLTPEEILKKNWGYSSFRPLQREIVQSALDRRDTLALLPTGGGKSICFQVPALMLGGVCLVITPLIALMKDQVEQLKKERFGPPLCMRGYLQLKSITPWIVAFMVIYNFCTFLPSDS